MKTPKELPSHGISRRDGLKLSGLALGGLTLGSKAEAACNPPSARCYPTSQPTQQYTYYDNLQTMDYTQSPVVPGTPFPTPTDTPALEANEMRITFMGSSTR